MEDAIEHAALYSLPIGRPFGRKSFNKYRHLNFNDNYLEEQNIQHDLQWKEPQSRVTAIEYEVAHDMLNPDTAHIPGAHLQMGHHRWPHLRHYPFWKSQGEMGIVQDEDMIGPFHTFQPLPYPSNTPAAKERSIYKGKGRAGVRKKKR